MREFLGWAPTQTHTTTHPDGTVSVTTVTSEPRFDDSDREALWALWADELERCPECGQPRSVCSVRDTAWYPQRNVCWATAARNVAQRRFEALHKDAKPDEAGYLP
ncbi:MAG TPA: hypothetical protein VFL94_02125, partial [Actinomycetales bacterium]|nr:hypothetical protein [Actinomycetales bacterium]